VVTGTGARDGSLEISEAWSAISRRGAFLALVRSLAMRDIRGNCRKSGVRVSRFVSRSAVGADVTDQRNGGQKMLMALQAFAP